jgi:hypothetical protein
VFCIIAIIFSNFQNHQMKKLSLFAILIALLFVSCKKETEDTNYHVSFKKDGVNVNYTGVVLAHRDTSNGYVILTINGAHSINAPIEAMGIYIDNYPGSANIGAGQYLDNATSYTLLTTHEFGGASYEAGQTVAADGVQYNVPIAQHFKVTISEIDANTVKGTFGGDYYEDADVQNGNIIHITDGEFFAKFQ